MLLIISRTRSSPSVQHRRRVGCKRKQPPGGLVDADVGGLRGQHDGDQQLERCAVFQLGFRLGIELAQAAEEFLSLRAGHQLAHAWRHVLEIDGVVDGQSSLPRLPLLPHRHQQGKQEERTGRQAH
jgi:hypothetical protein